MVDVVRSGARAPTRESFSLARLFKAREAGVFLALLALCLFLTFATAGFLTSLNLLNVGRQISLLDIMAVGMTFVLISDEVDLSVGSTYAFCGLSSGMLICAGWPLLPAIGVGVLAGCAIGLINGLLSTYGRLPSLIATLGMLSMVRGAALILTSGEPVTVNVRNGAHKGVLKAFEFMGLGYLFGVVPMQLVFFVIIAAAAWFVLSMTNFGVRIFAVGGSAKAARVSGIDVNAMKIWAFILMGALAGFAGILSLAFLPSGQAGRTDVGLELDVPLAYREWQPLCTRCRFRRGRFPHPKEPGRRRPLAFIRLQPDPRLGSRQRQERSLPRRPRHHLRAKSPRCLLRTEQP